MASKQYKVEFKAEWGFAVALVAKRLGVYSHSLYQWLCRAKSDALAGRPRGRCCNCTRIRQRCGL